MKKTQNSEFSAKKQNVLGSLIMALVAAGSLALFTIFFRNATTRPTSGRFGSMTPSLRPNPDSNTLIQNSHQIQKVVNMPKIPPQMEIAASIVQSIKSSPVTGRGSMGIMASNTRARNSGSSSFLGARQTRALKWSFTEEHLIVDTQGNCLRVVNLNQGILLTGDAQLANIPIRKSLIQVPMQRFAQRLSQDRRIKPLQTSINIQSVIQSPADEPIIMLNSDSTYNYYRNNSRMVKVVLEHIESFFEDNPNLQFKIDYRKSDSDHVQQKGFLQSVGIEKKDGSTYHLPQSVHQGKTSDASLTRPEGIKTMKNWIISNGDITIAYLENLWASGKLTNSVEDISQYRHAISQCVQMDIDTCQRRGTLSMTIESHGSIQAAKVAIDDLQRLGREIGYATQPGDINQQAFPDIMKNMVDKMKIRAALIHKSSLKKGKPGQMAAYEKDILATNFTLVARDANNKCSSLLLDNAYQSDLQDVRSILNGGGSYKEQCKSSNAKELLKNLKNPKLHCNIYPRNATIR